MKKNLLNLFTILAFVAICMNASAQKRYVDEVFTNVLKTTNIEYDSNRSVNIFYTGPPTTPIVTAKLRCDIYQPQGDTAAVRPLIILASTGSYLPPIINQQPTGSKDDSSIVELATRFTKRGYVVMAVNYRLGWNPKTTIQAQATEQLIQATYRAIQDVRNAIRFMRVNAGTYKIDTSKIIVGGQGTGGYIALGLASVDKRSEIEGRIKFQRGDFTPMVNVDTLGDWNGLGGWPYLNYGGDANVSGNAHMVFNYGGAMGDSTWMDNSTLPIVGMHCPTDFFAPYRTGNVIVPTTGITVINSASGAGAVVPFANSLGINNKINSYNYNDAVSTRALTVTGGVKNLYPFISNFPAEGSPWEWWDRPSVQANNTYGLGSGRNADSLAMLTNPFMSAARAKAYIDTIAQFISPRIAIQFDLLDRVKPVITLNGSSTLAIKKDSLYNEQGATATDDRDGNITSKIVITGAVNTAIVGTYVVTYSVSDMAGNMDSIHRTITVTMGDTTRPTMVLLGKNPDTLQRTMSYVDPGATANDVTDGNISSLITKTSNLDSSKIGTYTITYSVKNSSNIIANISRTVIVIAKTSVQEVNISNLLGLYPNPAKENVTISMDKTQANISQITLFDITGKVLISNSNITAHEFVLNTENLTKGIYLVNVKLANGASATKRLAIQ